MANRRTFVLLISLSLFGFTFASALSAQDGCVLNVDCTATLGVPASVLAEYPEPDVQPLVIDDSLLYDRVYRRVAGSLQVFNAPGGSVTATTGAGFSFITVKSTQGEWSQIDTDEWVRSADLDDNVLISRFAGVRLPEDGLPYPMAWTLRHLRPSATPGAEESPNNPFLYRYTRVSLYTYVEIEGYRWYQIADDQWVHQFDVAKITPIERPADVDTDKWIGIDLYEQTLIAYEGETPVFSTLISSGLKDWSTNEGLFHVYLRYPRTSMSGAYQQPDFYYLQEVPWTMYFDGDIALHGTYWHDGFGYRASHGCVNASITDAAWLYEWAADEFDYTIAEDVGPAIYVYSSGQYTA
jgi:hypothetical protein